MPFGRWVSDHGGRRVIIEDADGSAACMHARARSEQHRCIHLLISISFIAIPSPFSQLQQANIGATDIGRMKEAGIFSIKKLMQMPTKVHASRRLHLISTATLSLARAAEPTYPPPVSTPSRNCSRSAASARPRSKRSRLPLRRSCRWGWCGRGVLASTPGRRPSR